MQPEPSNTTLIISAETPKSERISVGTPAAMASSAAVDETVTNPRADRSASGIEPVANLMLPSSIRPCSTRSAIRSG
jgi:hypothetical protein